jgi:diamine N-acetyltransferase
MQLKILNKLNLNDIKNIQSVLEAAPKYSMNVSGHLQNANAAREVFAALSSSFDHKNKFVLGIEVGVDVVGCIDLLRGFPNTQTAMIGLLLLSEKYQGKGFGKTAYQALESMILDWDEITIIRISVVVNNGEVLPFWKKLGFQDSGVRRPYENGSITSEAIILEKQIRSYI